LKIKALNSDLLRKQSEMENVEHGIGVFASTLVKVD